MLFMINLISFTIYLSKKIRIDSINASLASTVAIGSSSKEQLHPELWRWYRKLCCIYKIYEIQPAIKFLRTDILKYIRPFLHKIFQCHNWRANKWVARLRLDLSHIKAWRKPFLRTWGYEQLHRYSESSL